MGKLMKNCRLCEQPMKPSPFSMCPVCLKDLIKVRNLVVKEPYVSIEQISAHTQVSFAKVERMVNLGFSNMSRKNVHVH